MAATLAEPVVLAAAKDALYPDLESEPGQYAVTESQFTRETWGEWSIPSAVRDRLGPFNTIRLASGEPDLLAVGMPAVEVLNGQVATDPVLALEAKGDTSSTTADVARAIEQAHAHLPAVNLGFVAAPTRRIDDAARSLARELGVGIVGVDGLESARVIEPARVLGAGEFSTGVEAIRFQARTHRYTAGSFPVNHPKNYLGYALALAAEGDTRETYADCVIRAVDEGRHGAILLDLIEDGAGGDRLTHRGAEVVRFASAECGSVEAALETVDEWTGRRTRFTELAPRWAQLARAVAMSYEPTRLIVDALETLHRDGVRSATLPEVARVACRLNRPLAVEVFFTASRREDVLTIDGTLDEAALSDPEVYKSGLHFQFKAQLYHVGLLTTGGSDDKSVAMEDEWRLEHPVRQL